MVFSPAFRSDATVFISGFKLGVARSTDGGNTFQTLWGSDQAAVASLYQEPHLIVAVHLAISPSYGTADRELVATVSMHPTASCIEADLWNTTLWDRRCYAGASVGRTADGVMRRVIAYLIASRDGGSTWYQLGAPGRWNDVRLVSSLPQASISAAPLVVAIRAHRLVAHNLSSDDPDSWRPLTVRPRQPGGAPRVLNPRREFALGGLAVHGSALFAASLKGTGAILGHVKANGAVVGLKRLSLRFATEGERYNRTAEFANTYLPPPDHLRGLGTMAAFSPRFTTDRLIFGASGFSVLVSADLGASWSELFRVPNTLLGKPCEWAQRYKFPGCVACRYSEGRNPHHFQSETNELYADAGPLCLACRPGLERVPQGPRQGCGGKRFGRKSAAFVKKLGGFGKKLGRRRLADVSDGGGLEEASRIMVAVMSGGSRALDAGLEQLCTAHATCRIYLDQTRRATTSSLVSWAIRLSPSEYCGSSTDLCTPNVNSNYCCDPNTGYSPGSGKPQIFFCQPHRQATFASQYRFLAAIQHAKTLVAERRISWLLLVDDDVCPAAARTPQPCVCTSALSFTHSFGAEPMADHHQRGTPAGYATGVGPYRGADARRRRVGQEHGPHVRRQRCALLGARGGADEGDRLRSALQQHVQPVGLDGHDLRTDEWHQDRPLEELWDLRYAASPHTTLLVASCCAVSLLSAVRRCGSGQGTDNWRNYFARLRRGCGFAQVSDSYMRKKLEPKNPKIFANFCREMKELVPLMHDRGACSRHAAAAITASLPTSSSRSTGSRSASCKDPDDGSRCWKACCSFPRGKAAKDCGCSWAKWKGTNRTERELPRRELRHGASCSSSCDSNGRCMPLRFLLGTQKAGTTSSLQDARNVAHACAASNPEPGCMAIPPVFGCTPNRGSNRQLADDRLWPATHTFGPRIGTDKETHYLLEDYKRRQTMIKPHLGAQSTQIWRRCFMSMFRARACQQRCFVEATPDNMADPHAPLSLSKWMIPKERSQARFVVVLREPIARDLSWFNHRRDLHAKVAAAVGPAHAKAAVNLRWLAIPPNLTYDAYTERQLAAWNKCAWWWKGGGDKVPLSEAYTRCFNAVDEGDPSVLIRVEDLLHGAYAPQLERWATAFSRAQITVLSYEAFKTDPLSHEAALFQGLALPAARRKPSDKIVKYNSRRSSHKTSTIRCATRAALLAFFAPWNQKLYEMEKGLSRWPDDAVPCKDMDKVRERPAKAAKASRAAIKWAKRMEVAADLRGRARGRGQKGLGGRGLAGSSVSWLPFRGRL